MRPQVLLLSTATHGDWQAKGNLDAFIIRLSLWLQSGSLACRKQGATLRFLVAKTTLFYLQSKWRSSPAAQILTASLVSGSLLWCQLEEEPLSSSKIWISSLQYLRPHFSGWEISTLWALLLAPISAVLSSKKIQTGRVLSPNSSK
jgi:hypothetical protein